MSTSTILIVDDNPENLTVLGELLCDRYRVRAASSGARALQLALQDPLPDLILLDVMMPVMSGYEVLQRLRADRRSSDIPVIFLTAMNSEEDEQRGLLMGAVDYITKPLRPAIVLARVHTHLELKRAREQLQRDKAALMNEVAQRLHEQLVVQDITLRALTRLAEVRDNETGSHIRRTQLYVAQLAQLVRAHPRFAAELNDSSIEMIAKSAPLHDIGKVGIPDRVLLKPGKLTPEEWAIMQTHAALGADALARAEADTTEPVQFLAYAKQVARHHHERWDGRGYPDKLAGEDIPLAARLMALADVFDAMISRRVYKDPLPMDKVRSALAEQRGKHFDPDLLDAFLKNYDSFCAIALQHPDDNHVPAPGLAPVMSPAVAPAVASPEASSPTPAG